MEFSWQYFYDAVSRFSQLDDTARAFVIGTLVFLGALWIGLIVWTARDIANRTTNPFARIISVIIVFLLHLFGLFLYLLFRPALTITEREEIALEHDLLRQASQPDPEPEDIVCDVCGTAIHEKYQYCHECRNRLRQPCPGCKSLLDIRWRHCPYCGRPNIPDDKPAKESNRSKSVKKR